MGVLQTFHLFTLITVINHFMTVSISYGKKKPTLCPVHYSSPYTRNDIPTFLKQLFPGSNKANAGNNYQEEKQTLRQNFH